MAQAQAIESVLTKSTSMSAPQVEALLASDFGGRKTLRQSLEDMSDVNIDSVLKKISERMKVEYMKDIPFNDIAMDMIRNTNLTFAKANEVLPLKEDPQAVWVLTTNPLNLRVFDDL